MTENPKFKSAIATGLVVSMLSGPMVGEVKAEVNPNIGDSITCNLEGEIQSQEALKDKEQEIDELLQEKIDRLNQQFSDFVKNEGDFTKEKKSQMAIESETTEKLGKTELGIADRQPKLEGYLFDYVEKDGSLLLIMGFDDKDGNGFITPLQIPLYFLETQQKAKFTINKLSNNSLFETWKTLAVVTNGDTTKLFEYLDKTIGKVIAFTPAYLPFPNLDKYTGVDLEYGTEHNLKIGIAGRLIGLVATNEIKIENFNPKKYTDYDVIKLATYSEVGQIDISKVPMINPILYFPE